MAAATAAKSQSLASTSGRRPVCRSMRATLCWLLAWKPPCAPPGLLCCHVPWHARNAAIQHELLRAMAGSNGDRTMLPIGAAHRPFLEASLRALPWVTVVDPLSVTGGPAR